MEWADQSPLNFVLMHFWLLVFPESPTSIRCINLIIMAACVLVVHAIAKRAHRSTSVALTASLLAATTPMALWLVRDGRMYALQILLAALSILLLLRHADQRRVRDLVGLGLCCALGIYNHFFGFGVAGIALASLLALEWEEARIHSAPRAARTLLRPSLVGLGVAVIAIPQLMRLFALLSNPPVSADWSLPFNAYGFIMKLQTFWFVTGPWEPLRSKIPFVDELYFLCMYLLLLIGFLASSRRVRWLTLLWAVLPVALLGLVAGHVDLRDRYFGFIAPILWVGIARGAFGALPRRMPRPEFDTALKALRPVMLGIAFVTAWVLVSQKLPEPNYQWAKLMLGLDQLYRPEMRIYMPAKIKLGLPRAAAAALDVNPALRDVKRIHSDVRDAFESELERDLDFVFLYHRDHENKESKRWRERLVESDYEVLQIRARNVRAEIFSRRPLPSLEFAHLLPAGPSETDLVDLVDLLGRRLADPSRPREAAAELGDWLFARAGPGGEVSEAAFFMSQNGEAGSWLLGGDPADRMERRWGRSGSERAYMVHAIVGPGEVLAIGRPNAPCERAMRIGLRDAPDDPKEAIANAGEPVVEAMLYAGLKQVASLRLEDPGFVKLEPERGVCGAGSAQRFLVLRTDGPGSVEVMFEL
ncbi:MAG: glycosyltransferase family 39 protein [Deltaproteobacteria bacterium]|nr:glycosyltransferase family 39 protein [Deltaproteobacteria bacterium]